MTSNRGNQHNYFSYVFLQACYAADDKALAKKVTEFEAMLVTGKDFKAEGGQSNGKDKGETKEPTALEKVVAMRKEKANAKN